MRELPNPWSSLTDALTKNKSDKKTLSERIAPLHKILQEKMIRLKPKADDSANNSASKQEAPAVHTNKQNPISLSWARHQDEVREAQRLRYKVFAEEMGARLKPNKDGLDVDIFDDFNHLYPLSRISHYLAERQRQ